MNGCIPTSTGREGKPASRAKLNRVRLAFYRECVKEGLSDDDVQGIGYVVANMDDPRNVMAGIKASKKRQLKARAKKAWSTRRAKKAITA